MTKISHKPKIDQMPKMYSIFSILSAKFKLEIFTVTPKAFLVNVTA